MAQSAAKHVSMPEGAAADVAATASSSPAAAKGINSTGDKRIVSLSILHTSNLLALGIQPYGVVTQAGIIIGQDELLKGNQAGLEKIAPVYSLLYEDLGLNPIAGLIIE